MLLSVVNIEVNHATFNGKTALIYAVSLQRHDTIELLLRCPQTDSSLIDEEYKTALDRAKDRNDTESEDLFESRGTLQITKGHTCCSETINRGLHRAVRSKDLTWIKRFLICPGIDINVGNNDGYTPLNLATEKGLTEMVKIFLNDQRIDVNKPNTRGNQNVLLIASEGGHVAILRLLLLHPQTFVNMEDTNGATALSVAIQKYGTDSWFNTEYGSRKYFRILKLLLKCPKLEVPDGNFEVLDEVFPELNEIRSVARDVKQSCCLQTKENLLNAAWVGDFRAIRGLLHCPDSESNANIADEKGRTPLYIASMMGHQQAVNVLLSSEHTDVNINERVVGGTAFSIASEKSHFKVMRVLTENGQSDGNKGWCRDNWAKPCIISKDVPPATMSPTSGKLSKVTVS